MEETTRADAAPPERRLDERRAELWLRENRESPDSSNGYVERNGLPLARHRPF